MGPDGVLGARAVESPGAAGRGWEGCRGGLEDRAWTRRKLGREEGGFAECLLCAKRVSAAWCQRWCRMCRGSRKREAVCGAMASAFCFGGGEEIPACSPFAFSSRRDTAHESAVATGASPVGVLASGGRLGGLVHTHISGWDSSVSGEPVGFVFFTPSIAAGL